MAALLAGKNSLARRTIRLAIFAGGRAAASWQIGASNFQERTMAGEAQRVIEEFWRIQDGGDYTKLADLFAEDAFLEDPIWGQYRGREAILEFMTKMVEEMGTRKVHFTVDEICGDDHAVWARWTMHMEGAPSRGGVGIYKVEGGKLTYYRDYMDPPAGE
jgi:limonene-1,2-epoxide hydrolase